MRELIGGMLADWGVSIWRACKVQSMSGGQGQHQHLIPPDEV